MKDIKEFTITVEEKHLEESLTHQFSFNVCCNCPIALALKEKFPTQFRSMGFTEAFFDDESKYKSQAAAEFTWHASPLFKEHVPILRAMLPLFLTFTLIKE